MASDLFYQLNAFDYVNVPDALNAKTTDPSLLALQDVIKANATSGKSDRSHVVL